MNSSQLTPAHPRSLLRASAAALALVLGLSGQPLLADPGNDNLAPEVPSRLEVPDGSKVSFQADAIGVQIYVAQSSPTPTDPARLAWVFKEPAAVLYDNDGDVVGLHYAGPTWETESGSKVVGARVDGVVVDPTDIPWLLLRAVSTDGPGVLARTTFVQRVNTVGGLAPASPPTSLADVARVPYTADYYFFRAQH